MTILEKLVLAATGALFIFVVLLGGAGLLLHLLLHLKLAGLMA